MATKESIEKLNAKRFWIWIAVLVIIFVSAIEDACEKRRQDPLLDKNAYILSCDSE